jgi:uncharacterized protein (DUF952 family)
VRYQQRNSSVARTRWPVAAHIGAFARSQSAQGYSRFSIHRQVLLAAGFSHWLKQRGVALPYVN